MRMGGLGPAARYAALQGAVDGFGLGGGRQVQRRVQGSAAALVCGEPGRLLAEPLKAEHEPLVELFGQIVDFQPLLIAFRGLPRLA